MMMSFLYFFVTLSSLFLGLQAQVWERFHRYWLSSGVSVHAVRYEDLLTCPEECLRDLIAFIYVRHLLSIVFFCLLGFVYSRWDEMFCFGGFVS